MKTTHLLLLSLGIVLLTAVALHAEEAEDASPWTTKAGLSYVATSGNTDTSTLGLDFSAERLPEPWGYKFGLSYLTADEDGETSAERITASFRATRSLSERWNVFAGLSGEQNEFAGYDLRAVAEVGATYKALLGPVHSLSFDMGLSYTDEDYVDGGDDNFLGGIFGLDYQWKISDTATLGEKLLYYPNFDQSSKWRASSETSLQAAISSRLALKLAYLLRYENEPVEGFDDTDTTTTASLVLNF